MSLGDRAQVALIVTGTAAVLLAVFLFAGAPAIIAVGLSLAVAVAAKGWRVRAVRRLLISFVLAVLAYPVVVLLGLALVFGGGPLASGKWPSALTDMASAASAPQEQVQAASLGGYLDSAYAWRLPVAPSRVPSLTASLGLFPVPSDKAPQDFRGVFPSKWRPPQGRDLAYYSTPDFPAHERGPDGEHYFAGYDRRSQQLYVWFIRNF